MNTSHTRMDLCNNRKEKMKTLREYIAEYDPYRTDNPRYVPEDQATLQYARVSVIADDRWIGASLQPRHLTWLEARETDFVQGVENDYRHAEKLELVVECYEHKGEGSDKRELKGAEFSCSVWEPWIFLRYPVREMNAFRIQARIWTWVRAFYIGVRKQLQEIWK